jgi:hypothetical protein
MGTRGAMGFAIDGELKIAYNHFDSYPTGLGVDILEFLRTAELDKIKQQARDLTLVDSEAEPTPEQIEKLKQYANTNVSTRSLKDWYVLLHQTQGDPAKTLEAGYVEDGSDFPYDSLFCEWGYVVDLDANVLEAYKGFQEQPHTAGRFASPTTEPDRGYYPIKLLASWPLDELPSKEAFCEALESKEDNEA